MDAEAWVSVVWIERNWFPSQQMVEKTSTKIWEVCSECFECSTCCIGKSLILLCQKADEFGLLNTGHLPSITC